jgi:hypothetical protein
MITKIIITQKKVKTPQAAAALNTVIEIEIDIKGEKITKLATTKVLVDALQMILDHKIITDA